MNDKEYVNNKCKRCLNRNNDKDLCNIVQTISGEYRCSNEDVIEVGEYVRTREGYIGRLVQILNSLNSYVVDTKIDIGRRDNLPPTYLFLNESDITKHSKNIEEILEKHDIVSLKENTDNSCAAIELIDDIYEDVVESIRNKEIILISILSKEQYKKKCFEI